MDWSKVLDGIRAELLDCLQANLAVLADRQHGPGTHLALGARLHWSTVECSLENRLAQAEDLLGLRVTRRWENTDLHKVAGETPLYAVADAHDLSWVPYFGQRHMEHSFLVVGGGDTCEVVDAYHNATQWGEARPGVWHVPWDELPPATVLEIKAGDLPVLDRSALLRANVVAQPHASAPDDVERLVLDIWLFARSRGLHAAWLDSPEFSAHADAWLALTGQSYVAMRRVQRGAALVPSVPEELTRLLRRDAELARVHAVVTQELGDVFATNVQNGGTPLRQLPNFSSFRLVDVIERVEARLGVEVEPEALTPDRLRDVDSLCGLFARSGS